MAAGQIPDFALSSWLGEVLMNRISKLSVLVALALASTQALALDLGRIQVKSALDQPLLAEIPVHPDHPGEVDHLTATLAPAAAFERAGVDRTALEVPLAFTVVTGADGNKFIRVTSKQPVRKPYLDFLVQVTWPQGKMLREYVVLLDPVGMTSHTPSTVPATTASKAPAPARPAQQPAPSPSPAPAAPVSGGGQGGGTYGPVTYGDTLSHIARAHAIDGVSYQQMLVALKAANPDAFFRDNVNALKTGAVLRIPTREQALSVTRTAAVDAVREQNQTWQDAHAAPTTVASAGGSSTPVAAAGSGTRSEDHLALVPPGKSAGSNAAAGGGQAGATASQLRQDLARSKEALSSQQQANADLQSRVKALEQIADKNKRLLSLKDAEIATLQAKLAEARKQAGLPALPASSLVAAAAASVAPAAVPVAAGSSALATAASVTGATAVPAAAGTTEAATATASAMPVHAKAAPEATQHARPAPAPAATSAAPWYEQLWARVVLVVILILLIIWAFLRHRKSSGGAGKAGKERKPSLADQFDDSSFGRKPGTADADAADADAEPDVDGEDEDTLLTQLAEHPDNVDLHLELVGLYYDRHDVSSFEGAAEAMHAYVDDESQPEWQDVLAMGRELAPDHPLFAAAAAYHAEADEGEEAGDFVAEDASGDPVSTAGDAPEDFAPQDLDHDFESASNSLTADFHDEFVATGPESDAESGAATGLPDESEFDALPPLPPLGEEDDPLAHEQEPESSSHAAGETDEDVLDLSTESSAEETSEDGFFDDPVDTKLDLARAYIEMGDQEGARAMLQEALHEGSQVQKDAARKLLDDLD